jgi:exodeoxyribonuclease V gamma subunit
MLGGEDDLDEWHELQATLRQLFDDMHGGDLTQPLPLSVLRAALQQQLDDPARRAGGGGSVTFASMSSHRGLPYAVICAIGLNDGAFPAPAPPLEFDLMAQSPRRGDRQRRLDERALMLDLLLAARDCLHLSHTGRSVRDNAALPPSVLVAELLDLLVPAMADDAGSAAALRRARAQLVVEHGLQPFARQAFVDGGDQRLRSYNAELAEALRHSLAQRGALPAEAGSDEGDADDDGGFDDGTTTASWAPQPLFFPAALPPPQPAWRQVSLAQLIEFFRNPARYVLRRRLGIELPRAGDELQDDEALGPDAAARSLLARRLLPPLLRGADDHTLQALAGAGTELPAGRLGQRQLQRELLALRQFAQRVRDASVEPCLAPHSTSLEFAFGDETWVLGSAQAELRPSGLLRWRYGDSRAGDYLEAWLQHLVLCADSATPAARHTRWLSADGEFAFDACDDALAQLAALLGLYRRGLSEALHFYPRTAWQWVRHGRGKALAAWRSTRDRPFGEDADPAYGLALRGVDNALDGAFEALAQQVFGPLLSHLRDARVAP